MAEQKTIAVMGHVGMHNLGDELLFASTIQHMSREVPGVAFRLFSMNPEDSSRRYGVPAFPVRPPALPQVEGGGSGIWSRLAPGERYREWANERAFLRASRKNLEGVDLAIFPGSSQITEAYGGWRGFPRTLHRWARLCEQEGIPICFLSLGVEPIHHSISMRLIRRMVDIAEIFTLRDPVSIDRLRAFGVERPIEVVPDIGLAFDLPPAEQRPRPGEITIGINTIPYYHPDYWKAEDIEIYNAYREVLVEFTEAMVDRGHGVTLYGTTEWADRMVTDDVLEQLSERRGPEFASRICAPHIGTLDELWDVLRRLDYAVAARYHGVVTACLTGVPVLGMAYERKTLDVMEILGVGEFGALIPDITSEWLIEHLDRLISERDRVETTIEANVRTARAAVEDQFELTASLLKNDGR
jgi:polysaccharide pyruvyl transferase WcaK-like protein